MRVDYVSICICNFGGDLLIFRLNFGLLWYGFLFRRDWIDISRFERVWVGFYVGLGYVLLLKYRIYIR